MSNFDLKSFMVNEGLTRISRDRKKVLNDVKARQSNGEVISGKELYNFLPNTLYHITTRSIWDKIQKVGYLGFNYPDKTKNGSYWVDRESFNDRRKWQKPGWGVFLGTSPEVCMAHNLPEFEEKNIILLSVSKSVLNPENIYLDGDVIAGYEGADLEDLPMDNVPIFYAGKVSVKDIQISSKEVGTGERSDRTKQLILKHINTVISDFRKIGCEIELLGGTLSGHWYDIWFKPIRGLPEIQLIRYVWGNFDEGEGWGEVLTLITVPGSDFAPKDRIEAKRLAKSILSSKFPNHYMDLECWNSNYRMKEPKMNKKRFLDYLNGQ